MILQKKTKIAILFCALFFVSASVGGFGQFVNALPVEDSYEENDTLATAAEIVPDYYSDLTSTDNDYYKVFVPGDKDFEVTLYFDYLVDNMTVDLFYENGTLLLSGGYYYDGAVQAYLMATGFDQNITICAKSDLFSGVVYDMDIWLYGDPAQEEYTEPNNAFNEAYELPTGGEYLSNLWYNDSDWYKIWLEPDEELDIWIYFDNYTVTMDLRLYNGTEVYLYSGVVDGGSASLCYNNTLPYAHWVYWEVNGSEFGHEYSMDVWTIWSDPPIDDDWAEPNDTQNQSYYLGTGYFDSLAQYNDDWYKIWVDPDTNGHFELIYDNYSTWISCELWDDYGYLDGAIDCGGTLIVDFSTGAVGEWFYFFVTGESYGGYYSINVSLDGYDPSDDDFAEENDVQAEAYWLDYGYRTNGFIQSDVDWFQMGSMQGGNTLYVEMFYDTSVTELYLELYDSTGNPHGYSVTSYSDRKVLSWTAAGDYPSVFLRVTGPNNGDWYDLDVYYIIGGGDQDDWFEDNDSPEQYTWLNVPGEWSGLKQYDDDFYRFYGNPGDHIEIDLNCDPYSDVYVEEWQVGSNDFIQNDGSTEDGHLHMIIDVGDYGQDFLIVVRGSNMGSWYDLKISVNGDTQPSDNDWVNVDPSDVFVYDITIEFDDDGGARGLESYNGTLKIEVKNIHTEPGQLWLELGFSWDGIPLEFTGQFPDHLYYQIYSDGNVGENGSYFGIFPVILGNAFVLDAATMDLGPDFSWNITGDHTLEAEHIWGTPWWWGEATFDNDWVLDHLTFDMELRDENDNMYGKMHLTASRDDSNDTVDTSSDDTSGDDSSSGENTNPFGDFDMSSIPGYSGWSLAFPSIGLAGLLVVLIKKKRK